MNRLTVIRSCFVHGCCETNAGEANDVGRLESCGLMSVSLLLLQSKKQPKRYEDRDAASAGGAEEPVLDDPIAEKLRQQRCAAATTLQIGRVTGLTGGLEALNAHNTLAAVLGQTWAVQLVAEAAQLQGKWSGTVGWELQDAYLSYLDLASCQCLMHWLGVILR